MEANHFLLGESQKMTLPFIKSQICKKSIGKILNFNFKVSDFVLKKEKWPLRHCSLELEEKKRMFSFNTTNDHGEERFYYRQ